MSGKFTPIPYDASTDISGAEYRKISTDNDIALSKVFKARTYSDPAVTTEGYISLIGDLDDGRFLRIPLKRQNTGDIAPHGDDMLFLDNSGQLSAKIGGVTKPIIGQESQAGLFPVVATLPDPLTFPQGFSKIVFHQGVVKAYNTSSSSWINLS